METQTEIISIGSRDVTDDFFNKLRTVLVEILTGAPIVNRTEECIADEVLQRNFSNNITNTREVCNKIVPRKYCTRQQVKSGQRRDVVDCGKVVDRNSFEEGVLSFSEAISKCGSFYQTIEKTNQS